VKKTRRFARLGALLVLLGLMTAALTGAASGGASKAGKGIDPALLQKLKEKARGSVTLSVKSATSHAGFITVGQNGDLAPGSSGAAKGKAKQFLREYGALLGAGSESTLEEISSTTDALGATHVTYQQFYKDVPVWAGTVKAHLDAKGNLTAVNGVAVPEISLDVNAKLSAAEAASRAIATVVADPPVDEQGVAAELSASDLHAASTKLYVYRLGLPKGAEGTNQLVYEVTVSNDANVRDVVFVHAEVGKVVNRYSTTGEALFRRIFEGQGTSENPLPPIQVWQEGDDPNTLNPDQRRIHDFSGDSFWYFQNAFGRDSYDGLGHEMQIVNNDPTINCPNANWNGSTTNYCNGVTSDDVVAHEWGHAYTQFTHDLIYQWQPGALNESYSDIWGETVDLLNGLQTDSPGGVRAVGACSTHTPEIPIVQINSPASIARICAAGTAAFGPPITSSFTVTGDVALANDGIAPGSDACTALPAGSLAGKVGLVDRGTCGFAVKAKIAQNAGAIAVVVANNTGTGINGMAGVDPTIVIPSLMISLPNGNAIKSELNLSNTVNVTLRVRGGGSPPQDSYRWLMGEDSTAFGGAIRDMWTPTCLGDPGKVSDAEYHCDISDGGGVHSNSGVPNHGYALLVDGGMYNGQTVTAIGLTKAAAIYWRAQSEYQTKTSDFEDHANALDASCADLIGQPINNLSTTPGSSTVSNELISAADCTSVTAMAAAVELRKDPTAQCNFKPLLDQTKQSLCASQKNAPVIYEESFEDGLTGWTLTNAGVFPAGWEPKTDWVATSALPPGHSGSAAYAVDRDGQCGVPTGDRSGVMSLASPVIKLPAAGILSPRATFEHSIASEFGFDGGNVKISINGGAYAIVPAAAFIFNPYNTTMVTAAAGNTSPLEGQPGFSGSDGGQVTTLWGESQIDLTKAGVKPGDTIQLRFDFGMDGCGSIDGWYVDNVKIRACNTKKNASLAAFAVVGKND
jgi:Zn-dependent metalloprotease